MKTNSKVLKEQWECTLCSEIHPCRVEIISEPTKFSHINTQHKFVKRVCVCKESPVADWKLVNNKMEDEDE